MKFRKSTWAAPVALGMTMMVSAATSASAQTPPSQPPAQTPPAQAAPAPEEKPTFTGTAGVLLVQIKPEKTADYEAMIAKLKDALTKSEKPERKAMAKGWKVYKAAEPMGANTLYVHVIEPTAPGDYANPLRIIAEVFPTEVQDIYAKVKEGFVQTGLLNLTPVATLGAP
jgi:hypothetical protein